MVRAAEMLGTTAEWQEELGNTLEPKDGRLWISDTGDRSTLGFTEHSIEYRKELRFDQKR
jgi:hypothetical protein